MTKTQIRRKAFNPKIGYFDSEITKKVESKFAFAKPKDTSTKKPLVVYLHSMGCHYLSNGFDSTILSDMPEEFEEDFYYLHPLAPADDIFHVDSLYALIRETCQKNPNIDENRIYAIGYSMGARALWSLACEYPGLFAAIVPMAGYSCYIAAPKLKGLSVWAHHGVEDNVVPLEESSKMIGAIRRANMPFDDEKTVRFSRWKADHSIYPIIERIEIWDWMFQQTRGASHERDESLKDNIHRRFLSKNSG